MPIARKMANFANLFMVVSFLDGKTPAVYAFQFQDAFGSRKIEVGKFTVNYFIVVDGVVMRHVHNDEYAVVRHTVEGDGIEHPDGVIDPHFCRQTRGIEFEFECGISVAYEYRHVLAYVESVRVFFFADVYAAIEVYFDIHDGVGGCEKYCTVLLLGNDAVVAPTGGKGGVIAHAQVKFETFGMDVVR